MSLNLCDACETCALCIQKGCRPIEQAAPIEKKTCMLCHGEGWYWRPWADLAGVRPPVPVKETCAQCVSGKHRRSPALAPG